jgi:uncharacterized protein (TIGR02266 family)
MVTSADTPAERRRSERVELVGGELKVHLESLADFLATYAVNLSSTGMFLRLESAMHPDVGTRVSFTFDLGGDSAPIRGTAEVLWRRSGPQAGIGLRFSSLDPAAREIVEAVIRAKRREITR